MKLKSVAVLACFVIPACSVAPEPITGDVLPMKSIFSTMSDRPYECFGYNALKNSCKALVKRSVSGDRMKVEGEFLQFLRGRGTVTVRVVSDFKIGETSVCGNLADAEVSAQSSVIPPHVLDQVLAELKERFDDEGVQCNEYLQDSDGQFFIRSKDASGRVTGPLDQVWFFSEPKALSG